MFDFLPSRKEFNVDPSNAKHSSYLHYDIITDFLSLVFCSEHFISIKHRILATFNMKNKFNSDSLCAFNYIYS